MKEINGFLCCTWQEKQRRSHAEPDFWRPFSQVIMGKSKMPNANLFLSDQNKILFYGYSLHCSRLLSDTINVVPVFPFDFYKPMRFFIPYGVT